MLTSIENKDVATKLVNNVVGMCQKGRFKLMKFISNSRKVIATIPGERHQQKIKNQDLNVGKLPVECALDVHWNIENDCLGLKITLKYKPLGKGGSLQSAQYMIHLG